MSFEEQSFRNLVHFYREELLQVQNGANSSKVFNYSERKTLLKQGVLIGFFGVKEIQIRKAQVAQAAKALLIDLEVSH